MTTVDTARLMIMNMATQMVVAQVHRMGPLPAGFNFDPKGPDTQLLVSNLYTEWKVYYDGLSKAFGDRNAADGLGDPVPMPDPVGAGANADPASMIPNLITALPKLTGNPLLSQLLSALQGVIPPSAPATLNPTVSGS